MPGEVTICAVGDVYLQKPLSAFSTATSRTAGMEKLVAVMANADIRFANLEQVLTTRGYRMDVLNALRASPEVIQDVKRMGFQVVSLANSHTMDYGYEGLLDTLETLDKNGVQHAGAGKTLEEAGAPVILKRSGRRVAFVAFASTFFTGAAAGPSRPGMMPVRVFTSYVAEGFLLQSQPGTPPPVVTTAVSEDVERLVQCIREAKKRADFVVVSAHWGVAGQDALMDYQIEVGHAVIDAGADMVVGHHPHRLHAVEVYHGKPIFYSLGNFIFHPLPKGGNPVLTFRSRLNPSTVYGAMRSESVVVRAAFVPGQKGEIELVPVELGAGGEPRLATARRARQILAMLQALSAPFGTRLITEGSTGRLVL